MRLQAPHKRLFRDEANGDEFDIWAGPTHELCTLLHNRQLPNKYALNGAFAAATRVYVSLSLWLLLAELIALGF